MIAAPFPALVAGGENIQAPPPSPQRLAARMAEVYGVEPDCVVPVRGARHGLELILRLAMREQAPIAAFGDETEISGIARLYGRSIASTMPPKAFVVASPAQGAGEAIGADDLARIAAADPALIAVDERFAEISRTEALSRRAATSDNVVSIRSLEYLYGLAGAPVGALIAAPAVIARLREGLEPGALPSPLVRLAEAVLDPSRRAATLARAETLKSERARLVARLSSAAGIIAAEAGDGPSIVIRVADVKAAIAQCRAWGVDARIAKSGAVAASVADPASNDRLLAAFGAAKASVSRRRAEIVRDTAETRIVVTVDLDAPGKPDIATGVGYFDHMLAQVATHGGISLALRCEGDLEVDAHHTIEDCALAFGEALSKALGERRGYARFGFVLPMDEAEAQVSVDLGGRPFAVFDGAFSASHIGEYPTEMTPHVFRSLAQALGAAIHVAVKGENDHHMTEACFKAFGRALRQALAREGTGAPSTKGAIL